MSEAIPTDGEGTLAWLAAEIERYEAEAVKVVAHVILSSSRKENGALIRNRAYELAMRLAPLRAQMFAVRVHMAVLEAGK